MRYFALAVLALVPAFAKAGDVKIRITGSPVLPKLGEVSVVPAGKPGPDQKNFNAVLQTQEFGKEYDLLSGGPFDVYYTPAGGKPVLAVAKWKVKPGTNELKLDSHLGTIFVRGDDLPGASAIVLTAVGDPGPGEKGHAPIQKVAGYKDDAVVTEGFYSVWIVSDNGAKARRVANKVRILAGRQKVVPE